MYSRLSMFYHNAFDVGSHDVAASYLAFFVSFSMANLTASSTSSTIAVGWCLGTPVR